MAPREETKKKKKEGNSSQIQTPFPASKSTCKRNLLIRLDANSRLGSKTVTDMNVAHWFGRLFNFRLLRSPLAVVIWISLVARWLDTPSRWSGTFDQGGSPYPFPCLPLSPPPSCSYLHKFLHPSREEIEIDRLGFSVCVPVCCIVRTPPAFFTSVLLPTETASTISRSVPVIAPSPARSASALLHA